MEKWVGVTNFPMYSVSDQGRVRKNSNERILQLYETGFGVVVVGLVRNRKQYKRSVSLLVAKAFLEPPQEEAFDTPINLNGDRFNNHLSNLMWRPRWFAVRYNRQFRTSYPGRVNKPIRDVRSGDISRNSYACAVRYGLLESDVVLSILNKTYTWPTWQEFEIIEN